MDRVLLADDSKLMREMLTEMIDGFDGVELIAVATDGEEAIELFKRHSPDIVVFDIEMPEVNGTEAAQELGIADSPTTIFLSGDSRAPDNAAQVLHKPAEREELLAALDDAAVDAVPTDG